MNHPMYYGAWALIAGLGLVIWGDWVGAALVIPALPYYCERMVLEGAMMQVIKDREAVKAAGERLFSEMSQIGTIDEPSQEAHNQEKE